MSLVHQADGLLKMLMEINVRKLQRRRKALNKEEKIMGGSPVVKEIHYKALEAQ